MIRTIHHQLDRVRTDWKAALEQRRTAVPTSAEWTDAGVRGERLAAEYVRLLLDPTGSPPKH